MTQIGKYTREYFVNGASEKQQKSIESLEKKKQTIEKAKAKLNEKDFVGSVDEVKKRASQLSRQGQYSGGYLVNTIGVDNLVNILDANDDGKITSEEFRKLASLDMEEFDNSEISLSAQDMLQVYENAVSAKGAKVKATGFREETYHYEDGLEVVIKKDAKGNIEYKSEVIKLDDGSTQRTTYSYTNKTKYVSTSDSNGRVTSSKTDSGNLLTDREYTVEYKKDGSKKCTVASVGKVTTVERDANRNILSESTKVLYDSDGKIGATKQQDIGNCYVLSGINALNTTSGGRQIIKDAIKHNDDGSVTVTFKGLKQSVTFSAEEVALHQYTDKSKSFSAGDIDMNIIEMGVNKLKEKKLNSPVNPLEMFSFGSTVQVSDSATVDDPSNFGYLDEVFFYLTGKKPSTSSNARTISKYLDKKMNNSDDSAMTVSFKGYDSKFSQSDIMPAHAYSVSRVTKDTVYVVNPWDSSKEIAYPKEDFLKNVEWSASLNVPKTK